MDYLFYLKVLLISGISTTIIAGTIYGIVRLCEKNKINIIIAIILIFIMVFLIEIPSIIYIGNAFLYG